MSWQASGYLKGITGDVTRSEKLLLLLLGDYYDESRGWAWPGIERLAAEAMMSTRHTIRLLQSLEGKGVIRILRGEGTVNKYQFVGYKDTPDTMSPVTSDVTPPVTSGCHPSRHIADNGGVKRNAEEAYQLLVDETGTRSGVHSDKYWDSVPHDSLDLVDMTAVKEAVGWVTKAMNISGRCVLPTPPFLEHLSELGKFITRQGVKPDSSYILPVVDDVQRTQDRILYGVANRAGDIRAEIVQQVSWR